MTDTVGYYNRNAARYVADTVEVDLSALHRRFLAQVPAGIQNKNCSLPSI